MADYDMKEEGGLIDRIKESPRTVSALIIILIVAAAIYAFSGDNNQINGETADEAAVTEETTEEKGSESKEEAGLDGETADEAKDATDKKVAGDTNAAGEEKTVPKEATDKKPVAEPQRTDGSFIEVAEAGNGITHLARKASARWLSENQAGYAVSDEHRIFIEDYIQNKLGTQGLEMGQTMEIGFDVIQEAVAAAGELNESQLKNLSQYTSVLK